MQPILTRTHDGVFNNKHERNKNYDKYLFNGLFGEGDDGARIW